MFSIFDPTMILLIPAIALAAWAQWKVRATYNKYSEVPTRAARPGLRVAKDILRANRLESVGVEPVAGMLSDHYDPRAKAVRLSEGNYQSSSIAAVAVAAHEVGHAMQDGLGYAPLALRHNLFPVVNITSTMAMPLLLIGFLSNFPMLIDVGIVFFSVAVFFHVVTLPVEFNASSRALVQLRQGNYLDEGELAGAKKVLDAAALTYVAATAMALLQLLRFILLRRRA